MFYDHVYGTDPTKLPDVDKKWEKMGKKTLKKLTNFNIYIVEFLFKNKEKHLKTYFTPVYQKS